MKKAFTREVRWQALLNAYWVPINFEQVALLTIAVPASLLVLSKRYHVEDLARLASAAAFISMVVPPLVGALSDRLRRRGVARRDLILTGTAINILGLLWMVRADSTPMLSGGFLLATFGHQIGIAPYQALMPEIVPREHWGLSSGARGAATLLGTCAALAVASLITPNTTFFVCAVLLAAGALTVFAIRERRRAPVPAHAREDQARVSDWHDFVVVFLARGCTLFGITLLMTFVLYFFRDVLGFANPRAGTALVAGFSLLGAIAATVVAGWLSDRVTRKGVVAISGVPMLLCTLAFAFVPDARVVIPFAFMFGLGYGGFLGTDWALGIESVPQMRDVARDLGIWGIAAGLPAVLAPAFGGWVLSLYNDRLTGYRILFVAASASFALGSLIVLFVRNARRRAGPSTSLLPP